MKSKWEFIQLYIGLICASSFYFIRLNAFIELLRFSVLVGIFFFVKEFIYDPTYRFFREDITFILFKKEATRKEKIIILGHLLLTVVCTILMCLSKTIYALLPLLPILLKNIFWDRQKMTKYYCSIVDRATRKRNGKNREYNLNDSFDTTLHTYARHLFITINIFFMASIISGFLYFTNTVLFMLMLLGLYSVYQLCFRINYYKLGNSLLGLYTVLVIVAYGFINHLTWEQQIIELLLYLLVFAFIYMMKIQTADLELIQKGFLYKLQMNIPKEPL